MTATSPGLGSWWMYPMKPARVTEAVLSSINPSDYLMEKKYDGWRAILIVSHGIPELWTRERRRIEMPTNLDNQLRSLKLPEGTVLDGEIWNPEKRGGWKHAKGVECQITFWDAIRKGNQDLSRNPLEERKERLRNLVSPTDCVKIVEDFPATVKSIAAARAEAISARGNARSGFVHGVVIKRRESPRRDHATKSHEHSDWMKVVFDGMSGWAPR